MHWLVTGANGQLGREMVRALDGEHVTAAARWQLDITHTDDVADLVADHDIIINTAAWTDVDGAEKYEDHAELANFIGPAALANACAKYGKLLIHISTDHVFSGDMPPYAEDVATSPINTYGRTKAKGERAVRAMAPDHGYVLRTAWLYSLDGHNFLTAILGALETQTVVEVVGDQCGQPTWARALARGIRAMGMEAWKGDLAPGIYHGTSIGAASRYAFARAICEEAGIDPSRIIRTQTKSDPNIAPRPQASALSHWGTPVPRLGHWRAMLREAFTERL